MSLRNTLSLSIVCLCVLLLCAVGASAQTRTTPVEVENTPTVKIDAIDNAVRAQQGGTWNVGILSAQNTVKSPTQSAMYQCWTTDQVIANGATLDWSSWDLAGYKEARVILLSNSASPSLKASVYFVGPAGYAQSIGWVTFYPSSVGLVTQANFAGINYQCAFTVPLMSNRMKLGIENNTGGPVTISNSSWVYVVN
jgi:hypothetical protein